MSEEANKEQAKGAEQEKVNELTDEQLDEAAGGTAQSLTSRTEDDPSQFRKNDTSVAGDQYQTDTCHVDDYGSIDMEFKVEESRK